MRPAGPESAIVEPRSSMGMVAVQGKLYVFGGRNSEGSYVDSKQI